MFCEYVPYQTNRKCFMNMFLTKQIEDVFPYGICISVLENSRWIVFPFQISSIDDLYIYPENCMVFYVSFLPEQVANYSNFFPQEIETCVFPPRQMEGESCNILSNSPIKTAGLTLSWNNIASELVHLSVEIMPYSLWFSIITGDLSLSLPHSLILKNHIDNP